MKDMFRRLARSTASVIAECSYAQRRMIQLRTAGDRYVPDPEAAPETYAEFMFRTSGWLQHEPSARARAARARAHSPRR